MINSLAILHEKRFLKKCTSSTSSADFIDGWDRVDMSYGGSTIKNQCVGLLQMIQWFRGMHIPRSF